MYQMDVENSRDLGIRILQMYDCVSVLNALHDLIDFALFFVVNAPFKSPCSFVSSKLEKS